MMANDAVARPFMFLEIWSDPVRSGLLTPATIEIKLQSEAEPQSRNGAGEVWH